MSLYKANRTPCDDCGLVPVACYPLFCCVKGLLRQVSPTIQQEVITASTLLQHYLCQEPITGSSVIICLPRQFFFGSRLVLFCSCRHSLVQCASRKGHPPASQ